MSPVIVVFVIAVVACAVAHVAIVASVVRRATAVADTSVPRPRFVTEVVWALVPVLALALVLTATWVKVRERAVNDAAVLKIAR
jgi:hypothetical protein